MSQRKKRTVLLVEDNEHVRALNRSVLERADYIVLEAQSLAEVRSLLTGHPAIDLTVLDIMLPDGNGLDFVPVLQQQTHSPVLLLTSKREYADIVAGLTGGADDYMTKPYRIEELLARIAALMQKRSMPYLREGLACGFLQLDTAAHRAFLHGEDLLLQPREYAVLLYLVRHEGQRISARRLYQAVWKLPADGDAGAVKTTVSRLRKKLTGSGYTITSGWGAGYCFEPVNDPV